jgi:hypothetical protein
VSWDGLKPLENKSSSYPTNTTLRGEQWTARAKLSGGITEINLTMEIYISGDGGALIDGHMNYHDPGYLTSEWGVRPALWLRD